MNTETINPILHVNDPGFKPLKDFVLEITGLSYYRDRDEELASHVAERMKASILTDASAYMALLNDGPTGEEELDRLIERLTIGETHFFRHTEVFDALRETVIPALIKKNQERRCLRVWSAGCSIGAEPYSVAILLEREFGRQLEGWDVSILGTDINRQFLARARAGRYDEWTLRNIPDAIRTEEFHRDGQSWQIDNRHKTRIGLQYHNLVRHPYPSLINNLVAFDLILCRNVMIYFSPEIIARVLRSFSQCVVDGGWLILGHAEPLNGVEGMRTIGVPGAVLHQKIAERTSSLTAPTPARSSGSTSLWPKVNSLSPSVPMIFIPPREKIPSDKFPNPDINLTPLQRVHALADRGDLAQALKECRAQITRDAVDPEIHCCCGLLLASLGQASESREALRRAVYLDRKYVPAHYYLGLTCLKSNQTDEAVRCFRNTLALLSDGAQEQRWSNLDGLSIQDVIEMARMHLEVLQQP